MKVRDLMTTQVACVKDQEPLSAAARLMWECDCGAIPVEDSTGGRIVGMITDRDICMAAWSKDRPPSAILVWEAMSQDLFHVAPDDSLSSAGALMRSRQIRRVPVLEANGKLVGILSLADVVTQLPRPGARSAVTELTPTDIAGTLANICQPRATPHTLATAP